MFDNLREKLGSFREDAEAAAEENVEELDEDERPEESSTAPSDDTAHEDSAGEKPADSASEDATHQESDQPAADGHVASETGLAAAVSSTDEPEADDSPAADTADADRNGAAVEDAAEPEADNDATGFGRKVKSFATGKFVIDEADLEGPLHELELALLSSDVEMAVAQEILDSIRDDLVGETRTFTTSTGTVVEEALREAIYDVISVGQFDFEERIAQAEKPLTIVFTGVNGVGKTTSIAKLSRYLEERGYSSVMANGDTYRAGANEQIEQHAEALDTKLITHEQGGDPAAVLYDGVEYAQANDVDVVLGDTAGRLHTDEGLMDQLAKIDRVVDPDMTLFVDEAVAGQDAVNRAREFNDAAEVDGAILTKADADSNGGAAISIAEVTGKPILFLGVGQGYEDLERFDPEEMVDRLLADA